MRKNESSGLTQVRLSGTVTFKTLTFQETNLGKSFYKFERPFLSILETIRSELLTQKYLASGESKWPLKVNGPTTENLKSTLNYLDSNGAYFRFNWIKIFDSGFFC